MINEQQKLLKECRLAANLTQVDFGKLLKCSPQFIANCERGVGNLPLKMWRKLIRRGLAENITVYEALMADYSYWAMRFLL